MQENREKAAARVRPATPDDAALLAEVARHTFREAFQDVVGPADMAAYLAENFAPERVASDLADPASVFLLAFVDGEPAGYARLHFSDAPECVTGPSPVKLWRLYADPRWYGRGVGAALMRACLDAAAQRGGQTLWLTVNIYNARAIGFYRKWGFEVVGAATFKLGAEVHQDHVMARGV